MFNLLRYFLWLVVICALALSFDQLMISFPLTTPGLEATQKFYVDFRQRLVKLTSNQAAQVGKKTVKQTPEQPKDKPLSNDSIAKVISKTAVAKIKQEASRYLYVDDQGDLQFADHLEQIPKRYRNSAQALAK